MSTVPTLSSRIRVNEDVLFQDLHGEGVLLNLKTGVYFGLDPVGARMWKLLETGTRLPDVVVAVTTEFDVTTERCTEDLLALIGDMERHQLVTVETESNRADG